MKPHCINYAFEHRRELYGELLGLGLSGGSFEAGSAHPSFRFRNWLGFIEPIVTRAFGPLCIEEAATFDEAFIELFSWGADHPDRPFTSSELVGILQEAPDNFHGLRERIFSKTSAHARNSTLGRLLKLYSGKSHILSPTDVVSLVPAEGRKDKLSRYTFVVSKEPTCPAS